MLTDIPYRLTPRYTYLEICGAGGTGTVAKVLDRATEKTVALKILENVTDEGRALFTSEFRTLARLHHPCLIDVYDYGILPAGDPYFTMEYFEGEGIHRRFQALDAAARMIPFAARALDLLDALAYVHAAGIVHGDIKSSNVLVQGDALRLLDFGLSALVRTAGGISGTLEYMAPELVRGERATVLSDLYALGVVWFEMLTGTVPFEGTPDEILRAQMNDLAPAVIDRNPHVPRAVSDIVARMLVKEPHRRWQRCEEIADALAKAIDRDTQHRAARSGARSARQWVPVALVGRTAERTRLNGATGCVRITGDHGMGATRFVREYVVDRMVAGATVAHVQCTDHTTVRDCYAAICPAPGANGATVEELALRAADEVTECGSRAGIAVVIDDLERAEPSVRAFLADVSARTRSAAGVTFVTVDRATRPPSESCDIELTLTGLAPDDVAAVLRERYGDAPFTIPLAARLVAITGGNIGMIVMTVHALERTGGIAFGAGTWRCAADIATLTLPEDLGASLRAAYGIDLLMAEPVAGDVLRAAVFAREPLTIEMIEHVVQAGAGQVRQAVSRLVESGILERRGVVGSADMRVAFTGAPLRDAAATRAEGQRTRNIHRALAAVLRDHDAPPTVWAEHVFLAGDAAAAVSALESAGDEYRRQFAARSAAASYAQAVQAARQSKTAPAVIGALLLKSAAAAGMDGDRAAEGDAVQEAIVVASTAGDSGLLGRAYLREAEYLTATGDVARAERSAERGRAAAHEAGDPALEARCTAALAITFQRRGDAHHFLEHARTAVAMFRAAHLHEDAASIQIDVGFTHALFLNQPESALEEFEEARRGFEQAGSTRGVARAVGSAGLAHYMLGRFEDSLRALETAHELFVTVGDLRGQTSALANQSRSLLVLRRYPDAVARATNAIALAVRIRDRFAEQRALETLGAAYDRLGQYERAREALSRAYALAQEIGNRAAEASSLQLTGTVMLHRGQFDHARRALDQAREIADALNETDARVSVRLWLADLALRQPMPDAVSAKEHITEAEKHLVAGGRHGRESGLLQLRAESALLENNLVEARRFAAEALRAASEHPESDEEPHNVWLTHFKVFERSGDYATAKQSLDRAYALLLTAADRIADEQLRRGYLENIPEHVAIIDAYRRMKSPPLNVMPAANELMLRRLYDISRALNSVLDLTEVLNRLVDNALEVLHAERGLIFLFDEQEERLRLSVARNVDASTIEDASRISEGILTDVFQRGKPVVTLNAGGDPRFRDRASVVNFQLTTVFCVPLMLRERIIGSLYVDSRRTPTGTDENTATVEFLEAFANLAAVAIDNARLHEKLREENKYLRKEVEERYAFENIIGSAPAMKRVYELMRGALRGDSPVLIEGESGTGKELVGRAIHFNSKRKHGKFVAVDCGALPETLLDSELFGHKKGSFTGAIDDKVGFFEEANGGTIFLDEITNTSIAFQAKLLRVIQEGEVRRVGDAVARTVDVRVIAATNKVLQEEIRAQRFREDLFYRLNVIPIRLPALRERKEDIPFLVDFFLKRYVERLQSGIRGISGDLMNVFVNADWRGNVRELENTIHRMLIYASGETLTTKDLPPDFASAARPAAPSFARPAAGRQATIDEVQADHIAGVLRSTGGNKTEAAKILGVKRTTLIERMKRLKMM